MCSGLLNLLQTMEIQTIAKKSTNLYLALGENHITVKANNWSAENFKKARELNELAPEPVIPSCDSGQRIPCFDSCQLTIIWLSIIKLIQVAGVSHWFSCGTDGRTQGHVMTKISYMDRLTKFSQVWRRAQARVEQLVSCGLVLTMTLYKLIREDICAVAVFYIFAAWKKCYYHRMVLMKLKSIFFSFSLCHRGLCSFTDSRHDSQDGVISQLTFCHVLLYWISNWYLRWSRS